MTKAYVGVGSNINKDYHCRLAVERVSALGKAVRCSPVYESEPVGFAGPAFYNFVIELDTSMTLAEFHSALRQIECDAGRDEHAQKFHNRELDLDILLFGDDVSLNHPQVPRDDIYHYPFVIQPLYDLSPSLTIPEDGRTVQTLRNSRQDLHSITRIDFNIDGF